MRKIFTYSIFALACLSAIVSCQREKDWQRINDEKVLISLSGDIEQQNITRATDAGFAEGDHVGIWAVNYDGDDAGSLTLKDNQVNNARFTYDGSKWASDYDVYYKDKNTKVDIFGYYPYSSAISSVGAWPFEVQEDQSTISANGNMGGYEASDFLWAKREAVEPTANAVQLLFRHKMSCVVVTLQEGTGFSDGEFSSLSQSVLISNVKRNSTINLATGEVTATGAISARSIVPASYESGFRAIVVPQTVAAGINLFTITLGGTPYTYAEDVAFTYIAGKQHNFSITVNKKEEGGYDVTVETSISSWTNDTSSHEFTAREYVVVNVATPGTLGATLSSAGKDPQAIKYLKLTGTVNDSDFAFMRSNMTDLRGINMQEAAVSNGVIPSNAFNGKTLLTSFVFPDGEHENPITMIETNAFNGTSLAGTLILPEGLQKILTSAFRQTAINTIIFPSTLTEIGPSAFSLCSSLIGPLQFPNNLRKIGADAFNTCVSLVGPLVLPTELEELGGQAFAHCNSLSGSLQIPNKIKTIPNSAFSECNFNGSLILPDGLEEIGGFAFSMNDFKGELSLPRRLVSIGQYAFTSNSFTGSIVLPEDLTSLGAHAFQACPISGIISIPENLYILQTGTFFQCSQLEGVILNKNLTSIGDNCFKNCFQINSIVSMAEQPPLIGSGAFDGVAKDNFAVEVPEANVNDYSFATGWKDFNRITAHHDFSTSRRLYRTLNAEESKTIIVRAESNASWQVESKPEWVTVSPSSGTGKTDVTITVNALGTGAGNRDGDVVFLLDGKDYRSTVKVEQYDYTYADGQVLTEQTHSVGNGISIIFMGDCYDASNIASGDYLTDTRAAINHFFDIEPYSVYRDYFDIYIVLGKSEDSGVGSINTIKESKFGTQYSVTGGTLESNSSEAFVYARKINENLDLTKALIVMVLNSSDYGGVTHMWGDGSAIAICPKSTEAYPYDFRGLVQHEAGGHGFGKLADEYIYVNSFINACICTNPHLNEFMAAKARGWYDNLSETSNREDVPWSHLMYHDNYSNTVDIYEGGYFHTRGIFRSEPNSCMNNNIPYYSAISRESIVRRIMDYAGVPFSKEDFYNRDLANPTRSAHEMMPWGNDWQNYNINTKHSHPVYMGEHPEH